jgi:hypothetical protein
VVEGAMKDPHPGVREHGVILSEDFPECFSQLIKMTEDPSVRVAFQACLSLGEFSTQPVMQPMAWVMEKYGYDPWFQTAILSSEIGSSLNFLELLIRNGSFFKVELPEKAGFLEQFSYIVGARNEHGEMLGLLNALNSPMIKENSWRLSALKGLEEGIKSTKNPVAPDKQLHQALQKLSLNSTTEIKKAVENLRAVLKLNP